MIAAVQLGLPTLLLALLIFGFAPRLVLRVVVLALWRDDPRRRELLAELHAVPRPHRPFWVAEQIEVALVEGLLARFRARFIPTRARRWAVEVEHITMGPVARGKSIFLNVPRPGFSSRTVRSGRVLWRWRRFILVDLQFAGPVGDHLRGRRVFYLTGTTCLRMPRESAFGLGSFLSRSAQMMKEGRAVEESVTFPGDFDESDAI